MMITIKNDGHTGVNGTARLIGSSGDDTKARQRFFRQQGVVRPQPSQNERTAIN